MSKKFSKKLYDSKEWKIIRELVYEEMNGICEICGELGEEVHHKIWLTPKNINNVEITLGRNNLQLLCNRCHRHIHRPNKKVNDGLMFNEFGELIEI